VPEWRTSPVQRDRSSPQIGAADCGAQAFEGCRSLGYVADVSSFNSHDYGTNFFYGIETSSGVHKLSYTTMKTLSSE
jgi:hypothetical protein